MGEARSAVAGLHVAQAIDYAQDVIAGKIPACKWVKAACQRQLDDLARQNDPAWPYRFDEDAAERVCVFVELLPHIKGPLTGQLIRLQPWQVFLLTTVFGWLSKTTGKRRFRRVYIEVPRGNGKSAITSAVGLYMLALDGEGGSEVYSAATTSDQAKIVLRAAQQMARRSPEFRARFGVEVNAHTIAQPSSGSLFAAVSAEDNSLDGLAPHFASVDELHAHKTRGVHDVLKTSMGKRDQSLLFEITTAGSNRSGICYEVRGDAVKILERVYADESLFAVIYTIDEGDDWSESASWEKANPNWGVSVQPEIVGQLAAEAMRLPSAQNAFRTKHLDVWVNADTSWMDMGALARCADPLLTPEKFAGEPCVLMVDLSSKIDLAAMVQLFKRPDGHYYAFLRAYLPEAAVEQAANSQYAGWAAAGRLIVTEGNVLDYDAIERDADDIAGRFQIEEFAFDPFQATQFSVRLAQKGFRMVEMRPTVLNFSEPMKELEKLVLEGKFHFDGDPVLAWAISNVVCHRDAKDNIYPRKERPENKIDPAIALIGALARAMVQEEGMPLISWIDVPSAGAGGYSRTRLFETLGS